MREIFTVGHITNDIGPEDRLGGAAPFSAVAAKRLGMEAQLITKAPSTHPYLAELAQEGVGVTCLPVRDSRLQDNIATFENRYVGDTRHQIATNIQEQITAEDLGSFPEIPDGAVIMVATVMDDADPELFQRFSDKNYLVVTPQGYFREADAAGKVSQRPWEAAASLANAELVILSNADITFENGPSVPTYINDLRSECPLLVLTKGSNGLTIYTRDEKELDILPFKLDQKEIVSPTGAGDSCATAFLWAYLKTNDVRLAGVFAGMYPALKLMGVGEKASHGISALPSLEQVRKYIKRNRARVTDYLQANKLELAALIQLVEKEPAE